MAAVLYVLFAVTGVTVYRATIWLSHLKFTPNFRRTDPIITLLVTQLVDPLTFIVRTRSDTPILQNVRTLN